MSLWKIAWRSVQQRALASALTSFSMALGVMLVICVLSVHGIVSRSFRSNTNLGFNILVGAKGGSLQLTLNSVFYLSDPVENIPYDFYLEFADKTARRQAYENSLDKRNRDALREAWHEVIEHGGARDLGNSVDISILLAWKQFQSNDETVEGYRELFADAEGAKRVGLDVDRAGRFSPFTDFAIPLCLGDFVGRFRVIGTTPEFFSKLRFGRDGENKYGFSEGRCFETWNDEHGYFEAVVGATAARELGLKVGQEIEPAHGDPEMGGRAHHHGFHVVGILEPTGTPNDRGVFANIEGFYLMEDHAKPLAHGEELLDTGLDEPIHEGEHAHDDEAEHDVLPLPIEQREVTAVLVRTESAMVAGGIQTAINEGSVAQAVLPVAQIFRLFDTFVAPVQRVLLILTVLICVVSGVGILVSIYNSMSDRRHEIAVMRALGAGRNTVMTVILLESVCLSLVGGGCGWVLGHGLNVAASSRIEQQTGVSIGFFDLAPPVNLAEVLGADGSRPWLRKMRVSSELLLIPALILLAVIVGFFPALSAYRTDVGESLDR